MKPAVFLDRDGTICEEMGYIQSPSQLKLLPHASEAIQLLNTLGTLVVLATNQSAIARGLLTENTLLEIHHKMAKDFETGGAWIDKIYYCPHHPEFGSPPYRKDCDCRKPKTGMIDQAQRELEVDRSRSFMIGDKFSDIEFGKNGGLQTILVLTGYGQEEYDSQRHRWKFDPDFFADDILEAAKLIQRLIGTSH